MNAWLARIEARFESLSEGRRALVCLLIGAVVFFAVTYQGLALQWFGKEVYVTLQPIVRDMNVRKTHVPCAGGN